MKNCLTNGAVLLVSAAITAGHAARPSEFGISCEVSQFLQDERAKSWESLAKFEVAEQVILELPQMKHVVESLRQIRKGSQEENRKYEEIIYELNKFGAPCVDSQH